MSAPEDDRKSKPSGRVRHDSGGRAIWEWAVDSGKHAIESTSRLLQKLDLSGLRLLDDTEKTPPHGKADPSAPGNRPPTFGGPPEADPLANRRSFNPYDSQTPTGRGVTPPKKPAAAPKPRVTQPARPEKKPGLIARLLGRGK